MFKRFFVLAALLLPLSVSAQVNPCWTTDSFRIVILGSSTAAGTGPSSSDSAWVNRFRVWMESLNPGNEVINRAQGGYTTYRSMPTGYQPPANRPDPDTTKNITYALSLSPDAIVVNYPSNDVSSGFTVAEQMDNLDTIVGHANAANVPIWICTTQPKDFSIASGNIQKQMDVRDSIFARYGAFAVDFWTGFADSNNQLAAWCDADGTHMNDAGHKVLFERVRDANIPGYLFQSAPFTDYLPSSIQPLFLPICGDSNALIRTRYYNGGATDSGSLLDTRLEVWRDGVLQNTLLASNQTGLNSCDTDSSDFSVNTYQAGAYTLRFIVQSNNDGDHSNDTLSWNFQSQGHPQAVAAGDTACSQSQLTLQVQNTAGDTVFWYDSPMATSPVGNGPQFISPVLSTSDTFYAEVIRGNLFYTESLSTTYNSNINWNGAMFDLIADSALVLDSFSLKIADAGLQTVEIYTRAGSHIGYQTDANAWTLSGTDQVSVNTAGDVVSISAAGLNMLPGDTLGVYLQLQNPGSRLAYQSLSNPVLRSSDELSIQTGSGVSHNFSNSFFPRDWNGTVHYHFGNRPGGDCSSGRLPVYAVISQPEISLGNDTILDLSQSITLNAGPGFSTYTWSTGATGQTLSLNGSQYGTGVYTIVVQATDPSGCIAVDSIVVVFAPLVEREPSILLELSISPNPSQGIIRLNWTGLDSNGGLQILNTEGRLVYQQPQWSHGEALSLDLPAGLYFCKLRVADQTLSKKVLILGQNP